jgi:chromatin segregation and condensation protein Rec8/ScpA/Scc1 (kleisin family)
MSAREIVLSGIRPTGAAHLGNYVGALRNWVRLQETHDCYFCIVDWHALSSEYADPKGIRDNVFDLACDLLSLGLDPEKCVLFVQSAVKEHAELHLILSMITPLPWLERVPTFKEQQQELADKELNTYGFLGYPLLQTADILIYKAAAVPVGEDQAYHLELAREIARRFNRLYGPVFPEPKMLLTEVPKLAGTDGRKMSKSYGNAIYLKDRPDGDRHAAEATLRPRGAERLPGLHPAQGLRRSRGTGNPGRGLPDGDRRLSRMQEGRHRQAHRVPDPVLGEAESPGGRARPGPGYPRSRQRQGRADRPKDHGRGPVRHRVLAVPETTEGYQVRLEIFEGPLDLLLFLIRKKKIDIHDIPIAAITRDYLEYLDRKELINLDREAEFLFVAALLIYIKSQMLLPREKDLAEEEDPRRALVNRLLEFQKVKAACSLLREREDDQLRQWKRNFLPPLPGEEDLDFAEVSLFDLAESFFVIMQRRAARDFKVIRGKDVSLEDKMKEMVATLEVEGPFDFLEYFERQETMEEALVAFFGLLELVKSRTVQAVQDGIFKTIRVQLRRDPRRTHAHE